MCRIIAISSRGAIPGGFAVSFRNLATSGNTPYGTYQQTIAIGQLPGHRDGWGVAVSKSGHWIGEPTISDVDSEAGLGDASRDDSGFLEAVTRSDLSGPGVLIAHLRRRSSGDACNRNTHPFMESGFVFCHNGSIPGLAEADSRTPDLEQKNDSRVMFTRILDRIRVGSLPDRAVSDTIREIHANYPDSTSLTCVLSDGSTIWAVRDFRGLDGSRAEKYYTMYLSTQGLDPGTCLVCQEPIQAGSDRSQVKWELMKNLEMVSLRDGQMIDRRLLQT